jgi:hypothetical protein
LCQTLGLIITNLKLSLQKKFCKIGQKKLSKKHKQDEDKCQELLQICKVGLNTVSFSIKDGEKENISYRKVNKLN